MPKLPRYKIRRVEKVLPYQSATKRKAAAKTIVDAMLAKERNGNTESSNAQQLAVQ
ncbi:MAG: hypothetical protein ACRELE_06230 [Gemmatimonadales bacterium]